MSTLIDFPDPNLQPIYTYGTVTYNWNGVDKWVPEGGDAGITDHTELTSIGTLTHAQIDSAIAINNAKVGITPTQASDITTNNAKVGITPTQASDITTNNSKTGITTQQASDITANNAKVGITPTQASDITNNKIKYVEIGYAISDEESDLVVGNAVATFRIPYAMTVTDVRASVTNPPTGSTIILDINGVLGATKLTIDATERTSETAVATPNPLNVSIADDVEITVDIDQIGSTLAGTGLKVYLIGYKS